MAQYYKTPERIPRSMFVPQPLAFLQTQMEARQERYDKAKELEAISYDKFSTVPTYNIEDEALKKQIVDAEFEAWNRKVEEQYGGDYGAALNELPKHITNVGKSDFWTALSIKEQAMKDKEAVLKQHPEPDLFIFGDNTTKSVGKLINGKTVIDKSPDTYRYDYAVKQDYPKITKEIVGNIKGDITEGAMNSLLNQGIDLNKVSSYGSLTPEQIANVAEAKLMSYHGKTPELTRAFNSGLIEGFSPTGDEVSEVSLSSKYGKQFIHRFQNPVSEAEAYKFKQLYEAAVEQAYLAKESQYIRNPSDGSQSGKTTPTNENLGVTTYSTILSTDLDKGTKNAYAKYFTTKSDSYKQAISEIAKEKDQRIGEVNGNWYIVDPKITDQNVKQFPGAIKLSNGKYANGSEFASTDLINSYTDKEAVYQTMLQDASKINEAIINEAIKMSSKNGNPTLTVEKLTDGTYQLLPRNPEYVGNTDASKKSYLDIYNALDNVYSIVGNWMDGNLGTIGEFLNMSKELDLAINDYSRKLNVKDLTPKAKESYNIALSNLANIKGTVDKYASVIQKLGTTTQTPLSMAAEIAGFTINYQDANLLSSYKNLGAILNIDNLKSVRDLAAYNVVGPKAKEFTFRTTQDEQKEQALYMLDKPTEDGYETELRVFGTLPLRDHKGKLITDSEEYSKIFNGKKIELAGVAYVPSYGGWVSAITVNTPGQYGTYTGPGEAYYVTDNRWGQQLKNSNPPEWAVQQMVQGIESRIKDTKDVLPVDVPFDGKNYTVVKREDDNYEFFFGGKRASYPSLKAGIMEGIVGNGIENGGSVIDKNNYTNFGDLDKGPGVSLNGAKPSLKMNNNPGNIMIPASTIKNVSNINNVQNPTSGKYYDPSSYFVANSQTYYPAIYGTPEEGILALYNMANKKAEKAKTIGEYTVSYLGGSNKAIGNDNNKYSNTMLKAAHTNGWIDHAFYNSNINNASSVTMQELFNNISKNKNGNKPLNEIQKQKILANLHVTQEKGAQVANNWFSNYYDYFFPTWEQ